MAFLIGGANTESAAYEIDNSLRFNDGDEPDLDITSADGNEDIWSWSAWVKRSALKASGEQFLFCGSGDGSNNTEIKFQNDQFTYINYDASSNNSYIRTTAKYRDVSAWYHLVVIIDMSQGTDTDRIKLYVNGVRNTTLDQTTYAGQNVDTYMNVNSGTHRIGADARTAANWFGGYMAEMHFVDGTAKEASDFGEFDGDSGIWKPKEYTGSYGTNGFYMEFKQTGTSANASGIGADTSGNGKHYTPANLAATDICTDTPTNNFATLNPLMASLPTNAVYQGMFEGNTGSWTSSADNSADYRQWSSIAIPHTEKWYIETKWSRNQGDHGKGRLGILAFQDDVTHGVVLDGEFDKIVNNSASSYGSGQMAYGEIFGALYDLANDEVTFYEAGSSLGTISWTPNSSYTYYHVVFADGQSLEYKVNFGNPAFSISSGNNDPAGYGNFEYGTNSGYALCTKNLAEYG
jgi:hypothetical protein